MTKEEENRALDSMWLKVREWMRDQTSFSSVRDFNFPHEVYHWTTLQVFPGGDCVLTCGTHGAPGQPSVLIHGDEEFNFSPGSCGPGWYGRISQLDEIRESPRRTYVGYRPKYVSYFLLRRLYDNWEYVKGIIRGAVYADRGLVRFEA